MAGNAEYWRIYRKEHGKEMAVARREKYKTDEDFRERKKAIKRKYYQGIKRKMMEELGGVRCVWPGCTCTDIRLLEFDHINQDGAKDCKRSERQANFIVMDLYKGKKSKDGFRVLCKLHNALAYMEYKYPDLKGKIKVTYE